jgi:hypothetical protein
VGVITGWELGLGAAFLLIKLDSFHVQCWNKRSPPLQVGISFLLSISMTLVEYAIGAIISPPPDRLAWAGFPFNACTLAEY